MLILASASPRRQELLRNAGIDFSIRPANIPEIPFPGESPQNFAQRAACEKAMAVFRGYPGEVVLGADTVVVADGQILGKPQDSSDAARMLRLLSGRTHLVITGVCLLGSAAVPSQRAQLGFEEVRSETTIVTMDPIGEADIQSYASSDEPMDKAGAYAIQGIASRWITRIEGDYCNVVGLPVALVWRMLKQHNTI